MINSDNVDLLKISGATEFPQKDLLNLIPIGKPNIFFVNFFTKKDSYTDSGLGQGIELLTDHYLNAGYLDFKITAHKLATLLWCYRENLFEGVCSELTSSWPPARVEGWFRAAGRTRFPLAAGDSKDSGDEFHDLIF